MIGRSGSETHALCPLQQLLAVVILVNYIIGFTGRQGRTEEVDFGDLKKIGKARQRIIIVNNFLTCKYSHLIVKNPENCMQNPFSHA